MKAQMQQMQEKLKLLANNQVTKNHFDEKITPLQKRIDKQDEQLKKVDENFKKLEKKVEQEIPDTIYKEIHNQEKCKKSVVVFGLKEQPGNNDKERYVLDKEKVGRLLTAMNDFNLLSEGDISYRISRLGRFKAESEKPRPLQISFNNFTIRDIVLTCCKNLKGKEEWNGVSVVPDLTKTQQKLSKIMRNDLHKEARKKNDDRKESEINKFEFVVRGHYGLGNLRVIKIYLQQEDYEEEEDE